MAKPSDSAGGKPVLKLAGADTSVDVTSLAVYALDPQGKVLNAALINKEGQCDVPADALSSAARIVLASAPRGDEPPDLENAVPFSVRDFAERLKSDRLIEIDKSRWGVLFPFRRCADGSIEHCYPYPYVVFDLEKRALAGLEASTLKAKVQLEELALIPSDFPFFPRRC